MSVSAVWVDLDKVVQVGQYYKKRLDFYRTELPVVKFTDANLPHVCAYWSIIYVILVSKSKGASLIADGRNLSLKYVSFFEKQHRLSLHVKTFDDQLGIDHCGSSANAMILAMIRAYRTDNFSRNDVDICPKLQAKIRATMHTQSSDAIKKEQPFFAYVPKLQCSYRTNSRPGRDRRKLTEHEKNCKSNLKNM